MAASPRGPYRRSAEHGWMVERRVTGSRAAHVLDPVAAAAKDQDGRHAGRVLLTVGHGTADQQTFGHLLSQARIGMVVDIRRYPGSRAHPQMARAALEQWLPVLDIGYRWDERLGGRRHLAKGAPSLDPWWTVAAFGAYAAHTRTEGFRAGIQELTATIHDHPDGGVAVMCSETLWWRCHRRLVADVCVLAGGIDVRHLLHNGTVQPHPVAAGARLTNGGMIFWDG